MPISLLILLESEFNFLVFLAIGMIVLGRLLFARRRVVVSALKSTSLKKINEFKDNDRGKISGHVVYGGDTIFAPVSKRKCVYYRVIVEQYTSRDESYQWVKIIDEERAGDIVMHDGSGYAIIDSNGSTNFLVEDVIHFSDSPETLTSSLEDFLARHNVDPKGFFGTHKTLRYKEGVLEKGETFTVSGEGQWNETKDHKLNIPSEKVLVIIPGKTEQVYITDDPEAREVISE